VCHNGYIEEGDYMDYKELVEKLYKSQAYSDFVEEMNSMVEELTDGEVTSVMVDITPNEG